MSIKSAWFTSKELKRLTHDYPGYNWSPDNRARNGHHDQRCWSEGAYGSNILDRNRGDQHSVTIILEQLLAADKEAK